MIRARHIHLSTEWSSIVASMIEVLPSAERPHDSGRDARIAPHRSSSDP
jgi:hypothetical protein